jgi:hypothetical protein
MCYIVVSKGDRIMVRDEAFDEIEESLLKASRWLERRADDAQRDKHFDDEMNLAALRDRVERLRVELYKIYPYDPETRPEQQLISKLLDNPESK